MSICKTLISAPLEAGDSLLHTTQLPSTLLPALDCISTHLRRKNLPHLTLIVVQHSPATPSPPASPSLSYTTLPSPTRSLFGRSSTLSASSLGLNGKFASDAKTSTMGISRTRWPGLPSTPRDSRELGRVTSVLPSARDSLDAGISLLPSSPLPPKTSKFLAGVLAKTSAKFTRCPINLSSSSPASTEFVRRSVKQKHVLYRSDSLTLLSLDFLYTFKLKAQLYSRTWMTADLVAAVDEARRLVLVRGGRMERAEVESSYGWLKGSAGAMKAIEDSYRWTYCPQGIFAETKMEKVAQGTDLMRRKGDRRGVRGLKVVTGFERDTEGAGVLDQQWDISPVTPREWEDLMEGKLEYEYSYGCWTPVPAF